MKNQTMIKSTVSKFSLPFLALLPGVLLATSAVTAHAEAQQTGGIPAEIQGAVPPTVMGLQPVGPVMKGGSDHKSAVFQTEVLPNLTNFLNSNLGSKLNDSRIVLDAYMMKLKTASDVRMYFVGENSENLNSLLFHSTRIPGSYEGYKIGHIFPDVSSPVSTYDPAITAERQISAPLLPGDFVNYGNMEAGSVLDFFLISQSANGDRNWFWKNPLLNEDHTDHAVTFAYQKNSPYLIIGLEDTFGGGDRDFNDLVFALDIGAANVRALTSAPEPAMALTLVSFLGMALRRKRSLKLA
jgi:hypothetical protein